MTKLEQRLLNKIEGLLQSARQELGRESTKIEYKTKSLIGDESIEVTSEIAKACELSRGHSF